MLANRVKETTSSTGTGSFTLTGASANFQTFNAAFGTNRRFVYWAINDADNQWETGIGYLSAATTLVRETVLDNSSGTTVAINFTTAPELFCGLHNAGLVSPFRSAAAGDGYFKSAHLCFHQDGTNTLTADQAYYMPFKWECFNKITEIGVTFHSTVAGTKLRCGLYDVGADGNPSNLLIESGDLTPVANTIATSTLGTPLRLPPGWYYAALICDGASAVRADQENYTANNPLGLRAVSGNQWMRQYASETIGSGWSALPAAPAPSFSIHNASPPRIILVA